MEFAALEHLENPDLHVDSVRHINLYARLKELIASLDYPKKFTLKDLTRPDAERTEIFISALLNFCFHRDNKMNLLTPIMKEINLLEVNKREWETKISQLNAEMDEIKEARERELPYVQEVDAKLKELRQTIAELNNHQVSLRTAYRKLKEEGAKMDEKKHPKVANHANKKFKEFEKLQGIFGKDRAIGKRAETPADVIQEMQTDDKNTFDEEMESEQVPQSTEASSYASRDPSVRPTRKRPIAEYAAEFISMFQQSIRDVRSDFALLVGKIANPSRDDIVAELKTLGLSENEELDVLMQMATNPQYEKFFWRLEGEQRLAFVRRIIG